MGASAPTAPSFKLPSGAPSFIPSNTGVTGQTLLSSNTPGAQQIWNAFGNPDPTSAEGQAVGTSLMEQNAENINMQQQYPGYANMKNQYQTFGQNLLGTQTPASMNQGNALMNFGAGTLASGTQAINTGQGYANQAQNFFTPASQLASQASTAGNQDMSLGQSLINGQQAIDPQVQQELMQSGLQGAAGSLGGAAALGGQAGQAAVGRDLGVGAENWINQQRQSGMALQQTGAGLDTSLAGASGTLAGAGSSMAGAGAGLMNAGSGIINSGTGAMTAGQGIINNATSNANQTFAVGSSMFQPRQLGLSASDSANVALANTAGQNNMNQFIYGTKVGVAAQNAGIGASNANAQAAASNANTQAAVGVSTAVATTSATIAAMSCWLAAECFGRGSYKFHQFRFWLMNLSPKLVKRMYLTYGRQFADCVHNRPLLKIGVTCVMEAILWGTPRYALS